MKIVVSTDSLFSAACLKVEILKAIKGEKPDITIDTWAYKKSKDDFDVIFHNLDQYVADARKNVIFTVVQDDADILFSITWWKGNPEPSWEIKSLHAGRLVEMLMSHFNEEFVSFKIIDFN